MDSVIFQHSLRTLELYSYIYNNVATAQKEHTPEIRVALEKLENMIATIVYETHKNAKGQVA